VEQVIVTDGSNQFGDVSASQTESHDYEDESPREHSSTVLPATFQRKALSKATGCLAYILMIPLAAVFIALFLHFPIYYLLKKCGVPEEYAECTFPILLPIVTVGVVVWGTRDYRRRAALKVIIDRDGVVVDRATKVYSVSTAEVKGIHLVPTGSSVACILERADNSTMRLPPEIAPFSSVREPLEAALITRLVQDLDERMSRGQSLAVRESRLTAMRRILKGLFMILLAVRGIGFFRLGIRQIHQGWLWLKGGFALYGRGLCHPGGDERCLIPWDELECVRHDANGLVFRSPGGPTFAASPFAKNYWVAEVWIVTVPGVMMNQRRGACTSDSQEQEGATATRRDVDERQVPR